MKHVKHGKKLISLLLSAAVAMSMTLSTVMTPLAASSSVSDLRQRLQELQTEQEKVNQQLKDAQSNKADAALATASYPFVDLPSGDTLRCKLFTAGKF